MFAAGTIELTNLVFRPEHTIHFNPTPGKQEAVVEMTNNHEFDVIVKWKSTRPPIYGVEPNFTVVKAKTTKKFVLFCRNYEAEYSKPRDRFSAIISRIRTTKVPKTNVEAKHIWRDSRLSQPLFQGRLHKKFIYVVYKDLNPEEWWNRDRNGNIEQTQPTFGLVEDDETSHVLTALLAGQYRHVMVQMEPPARDDDAPPNDDDQNNN